MKLGSRMDGGVGTVAALGALAGARSMLPLAVVSRALKSRSAASLPASALPSRLAAWEELVDARRLARAHRRQAAGYPRAYRAAAPRGPRALGGRGGFRHRAAKRSQTRSAHGARGGVRGRWCARDLLVAQDAAERLSSSSARTGLVEDAVMLMGAGGHREDAREMSGSPRSRNGKLGVDMRRDSVLRTERLLERVVHFIQRHKWSLPLAVVSSASLLHLASEMREGELSGVDAAVARVVMGWRGSLDHVMYALTSLGGGKE